MQRHQRHEELGVDTSYRSIFRSHDPFDRSSKLYRSLLSPRSKFASLGWRHNTELVSTLRKCTLGKYVSKIKDRRNIIEFCRENPFANYLHESVVKDIEPYIKKIETELNNFPKNKATWNNCNVGTKLYEIYAILWYSDHSEYPMEEEPGAYDLVRSIIERCSAKVTEDRKTKAQKQNAKGRVTSRKITPSQPTGYNKAFPIQEEMYDRFFGKVPNSEILPFPCPDCNQFSLIGNISKDDLKQMQRNMKDDHAEAMALYYANGRSGRPPKVKSIHRLIMCMSGVSICTDAVSGKGCIKCYDRSRKGIKPKFDARGRSDCTMCNSHCYFVLKETQVAKYRIQKQEEGEYFCCLIYL